MLSLLSHTVYTQQPKKLSALYLSYGQGISANKDGTGNLYRAAATLAGPNKWGGSFAYKRNLVANYPADYFPGIFNVILEDHHQLHLFSFTALRTFRTNNERLRWSLEGGFAMGKFHRPIFTRRKLGLADLLLLPLIVAGNYNIQVDRQNVYGATLRGRCALDIFPWLGLETAVFADLLSTRSTAGLELSLNIGLLRRR